MTVDLWWRAEDSDYIRRRAERYPGALGIEAEWAVEVARDPQRIVRDPDPKSRRAAIRIIGYSPSAGFVVTVIVTIRPCGSHGLEDQRGGPSRIRSQGEVMTKDDRERRVEGEGAAIRVEYAEEEAEAAEAEIAERNAALDVPLNLRIDKELDAQLKRQAAAAQIPTSALVRRLLRQALHNPDAPVLTVEEVEAIARRVLADAG